MTKGRVDPRYGNASVAAPPWEDIERLLKEVVVEGTAVRVTDAGALQALAAAWFAKYDKDWEFEVRGQEFVEVSHSGGGTEGGAWVYRVETAKVMAFGGDHGQTTYRF
jgi:hypothetical protein